MDVVKVNIAKLNGTIDSETELGQGSCFTLKLPLTMAIINALLVRVAGQTYALHLSSVEEAVGITESEVKGVGKREVINLRGRVLPVVRLEAVLGLRSGTVTGGDGYRPVIVTGVAESRVGLIVDRILGKQEIVIKSLGDVLRKVKHISGGTILADGRVVPIVNVPSIVDAVTTGQFETESLRVGPQAASADLAQPLSRVIIAEDSEVIRKSYTHLFEGVPVSLTLAEDGLVALERLEREQFHLIVTDIMMPRMDGIELARRARTLPQYRNIPILVVSSMTGQDHLARALEAGVTEYIFKPFEGDRLLSTVKKYLRL
jgi:two-component system chemotaxis sensor kinase CheA